MRSGIVGLVLAVFVGAAVALSAAGTAMAAGCPNEAFRVGPSAQLPGCRAYEMVSPVEKGGGNVSQVINVRAAPSGNAVLFYSTSAFAGAEGSALNNAYIARRGSDWSTENVDAPQFNAGGGTLLLLPSPASSPELDQTLEFSTRALTPGAIEGGSNVYIRNDLTGTRRLVTAQEGDELFRNSVGSGLLFYLEGTADWSHILIRTTTKLTPEAEGTEDLYDFTGGEPHLVNFLPDGSVPPGGATPGGAMSADGSRIFFGAVGTEGTDGLYVREAGKTTAISVSRRSGEEGEVKTAEFGGASADGSIVYFIATPLTDGSAAAGGLYRYDLDTGQLTEIAPVKESLAEARVFAVSANGSSVFFSSRQALTEGATKPESGGSTNLYAWHEGQTKLIGQTTQGDQEGGAPAQAEASPNGLHLALGSFSPLNGEDVSSAANCPADPNFNNRAGDCRDVYSFDVESGALKCLSCNGLPGRGNSSLGGRSQVVREPGFGKEFPRAILDDGTVFFETPNRLVPRDSNGVGDVYAGRDGAMELISTGEGAQPSSFGDVTGNGENVYFVTSQPLVKQDTDASFDVYDDRELGGLASQWPAGAPAPCEGESCLGPPSSSPPGLPPGSGGGGEGPCAGAAAAAARAENRADTLRRRARSAGRHRGKAAKARARRLRGQAAKQQRQAKKLLGNAKQCGGESR